MRARPMDVAQVVLITLGADRAEPFIHDDLGKSDDRVQRRSDFVAHLGEKIGFYRTGALGLVTRRLLLLSRRLWTSRGCARRRRSSPAARLPLCGRD